MRYKKEERDRKRTIVCERERESVRERGEEKRRVGGNVRVKRERAVCYCSASLSKKKHFSQLNLVFEVSSKARLNKAPAWVVTYLNFLSHNINLLWPAFMVRPPGGDIKQLLIIKCDTVKGNEELFLCLMSNGVYKRNWKYFCVRVLSERNLLNKSKNSLSKKNVLCLFCFVCQRVYGQNLKCWEQF